MNVKARMQDTWAKTRVFLKDVRVELTKVTWPSWNELKGQTLVVVVAVLLIGAFTGVVDLVLSNLIKLLVTALT
jgi:preprotein translocase subunit SecE